MKMSILFRNWWVILIQGVLMIVLSIVIFNNPGAVLTAMAFWLGIIIMATGLVDIVGWIVNTKEQRSFYNLLSSIAIFIIGLLMISEMFITIKAITLVFGLLVTILGLVLLYGSWKGMEKWSWWWLIALSGAGALIMGIKSMIDVYSGAQNITNLIGISVFLAGTGLIFLAFLKRKTMKAIGQKVIRMGV
jgi:uncharacterized membrane protein HdeD (DUF308 family)